MAYITDYTLTELLASLLHKDATTLRTESPYWIPIITAANAQAYNLIRRTLAGRGYTAAQIAAWDDGAEYQKDLGLYFCFLKGGRPPTIDDFKIYDRREELATVVITTGTGTFRFPEGSPLSCGTGEYDTSDDLFGLDPNDSRRGSEDGARF